MLINDMLQQICENQDIIHSAYYGKFLNSAFQEWFRIFNFIRKPGFNKNLWGYQLWMEKISRWFYYQREKPIKEWGNFPYIEQLDWNNLRESIQNITSKMDFELIHNFHFF
jgi:actin-related protein